MAKIALIIVAGGSGSRMGASLPKQFINVAGKELLAWTVEKFIDAIPQSEIVVVLPHAHIDLWGAIADKNGLVGKHKVCAGGDSRFDSVKNGLAELRDSECEYIAIHDGVRPLLSEKMIHRCFMHAEKYETAIPLVETVDSFRVEDHGEMKIINRALLKAVQTPQIFRAEILRKAYEVDNKPCFTDDASVVEASGVKLSFCEGERRNVKITTHDDLLFAQAILSSREL